MAASGASSESEATAGLMPEQRKAQSLRKAAWTADVSPGQPVPSHQQAGSPRPEVQALHSVAKHRPATFMRLIAAAVPMTDTALGCI